MSVAVIKLSVSKNSALSPVRINFPACIDMCHACNRVRLLHNNSSNQLWKCVYKYWLMKDMCVCKSRHSFALLKATEGFMEKKKNFTASSKHLRNFVLFVFICGFNLFLLLCTVGIFRTFLTTAARQENFSQKNAIFYTTQSTKL